MPFAIEWYDFARDKWVQYKKLAFPTQEEAETLQASLSGTFRPENLRLAEIDDELRSGGSDALPSS